MSDTSREIWLQVVPAWRRRLMSRGLSVASADSLITRMQPLFAALRVGRQFVIAPDQEQAFRACWPSLQPQFEAIVHDVLTERFDAEVAAMMLRGAAMDMGGERRSTG